MLTIASQEIAQYRSQLSAYPEALKALDVIEDCEGDLEDAAITLAISAGQQPDTSDNWLALLAKRCRVPICEQEFREDLLNNNCTKAVEYLISTKLCPDLLVAPVVIYAIKTGVNEFCEPLEYKL